MSKKFGAFSAAEPAVTFITDRAQFSSMMDLLGKAGIGFQYFHNIDGNEIVEYRSVVAEGYGEEFVKRVEFVADFYGVKYSHIGKQDNLYRVLYIYEKALTFKHHEKVKKLFNRLLDADMLESTWILSQEDEKQAMLTMVDHSALQNVSALLDEAKDTSLFSGFNLNELQRANAIPVNEVQIALKTSYPEDAQLNFAKNIGLPFQLALSVQKSVGSAMRFFNTSFGLKFEVFKDVADKYSNDGVEIEPRRFAVGQSGYIREGEKGVVVISDFYIRVHYKVKGAEVSHIVSFYNPTTAEQSKKFQLDNTASKGKLAEVCMKQGGFHFGGTDKDVLDIHDSISKAQVPFIEDIAGYGVHKDKGIAIFHNGVYDIKDKRFHENPDGDAYYFTGSGTGYHVTDTNGNEIQEMYSAIAPRIHTGETRSYDEIYDQIEPLYKDETAHLIMMTACMFAGYAFLAPEEVKPPLVFIGGITGSGKSTFNEMLQIMFGLKASTAQKFDGISNFSLVHYLVNLVRVPLFMTEFRRLDTPEAKKKVGTLRSAFDGTGETKGRPDQSIIQYNYNASICIDGEEYAKDGATRSRTIILKIKKSSQTDGFMKNFKKFTYYKNFLFSYLEKADRKIWDEAFEEGIDLFVMRGVDARIKTNIAVMYASCVAYAPEKKEEFQVLCMGLLQEQMKDFMENGTSAEIIKVIGRYLAGGYANYINETDHIIIEWNGVLDYVNRYRISLNLDIETYKEHLEALGFPLDFYEINNGIVDKIVYGIKVPFEICPKEFLCTSDIYSSYKSWKNKNNP